MKFGIANFKAFGPHMQTVSLRPLTLVFGPNSAGKSSLIHSLLWAKDVLATGDPNVRKPSAASGQVDLGGFEQTQFQGKNAGDVALCVNVNSPSEGSDCKITFSYGTEVAMPNLWKTAASIVPNIVKEGRANGLTDVQITAKLVMQFHAAWVPYQLLSHHPGFEHVDVDWYHGFNPTRQASSQQKKRSWKYKRLARWIYPTVAKIWSRHPALAQKIKELSPPEYFEKIGDYDSGVLIPTIEAIGATLETISSEISAHYLLLSRTFMRSRPPDVALTKPRLVSVQIHRCQTNVLSANLLSDGMFWLSHVDQSILPENCPLRSIPRRAHHFLRLEVAEGKIHGLSFDVETYKGFARAFRPDDQTGIDETKWLPQINQSLKDWGLLNGELADSFSQLKYVGPLRWMPSRNGEQAISQAPGSASWSGMWQELIESSSLQQELNRWLSQEKLNLGYKTCVDHMIELRAAQKTVSEKVKEEFLRLRDSSGGLDGGLWRMGREHNRIDPIGRAVKGGYLGEAWASKKPDDDDRLNEEAFIRNLVESLEARLASPANSLLRFQDLKTGAKVALQDMGVGISQMLPLILRCLVEQGALIAIEQPEIHVHPKLQAELGDLFIESALKKQNCLVLETHSEHLILRIMRRIRETFEGTLPEARPPVTPEDICIIYLEPGENGSIIREMPLNERGELVKGWPGGFFEEALNEMF